MKRYYDFGLSNKIFVLNSTEQIFTICEMIISHFAVFSIEKSLKSSEYEQYNADDDNKIPLISQAYIDIWIGVMN